MVGDWFRRIIFACALAVLIFPSLARAQDGPPPHVRAAVRATVDMLSGEGDASIAGYIANAMAPDSGRDNTALTARLREMRDAVRGRADQVRVEAAPDGVIVQMSGPAGAAQIAVALSEAGVSDLRLLSANAGGGGGGGGDPARRHFQALENLPQDSLDTELAAFEREHFSSGFLARTPAAERRALIERIRAAVANAGGVLVSADDGAFTMALRGGARDADVVFRLEPNAPFAIDALELRDVVAMQLTPGNLAETFDGLAQNGFSGVVYVKRDGAVLLERAYGLANAELGAPVALDTVFGIGSTPITFTQAAIHLLAQRGAISLDDAIDRYFDNVPPDKRAITISQLMSGRSGLQDFFHNADDWNADLAWVSRDEAVRRMFAQELRFAPGTSRAHSHAAFGLLAALVERASGQSYYSFVRQNFLDPAGMTRTGLYGEDRGLSVRDFAVGPGPSIVGVPNIPPNWGPTSWLVMGSGGMYSTMGDMLRFYALIQAGNVLQGEHQRAFGGVGVGIGGSDQGFFILHAYNGADNVALMLVNMEGRSPDIQRLSGALERLVRAD